MWIAVAAAAALVALMLVISFIFAYCLVYPKTRSIQSAKERIMELGLWRDFDAMQKQAYTVTAADGYMLHAQMIAARQASRRFVIISHGYGCNWCYCVKYVHLFRDMGYHCIIYDNRGHGLNARSICTIGFREAQDLLDIIADARSRFGKDITIGLHGESMGAAQTAMALGKKPDVEFAILDCGYARLMDVVQHKAKRVYGVPKIFCYPVSWMCRLCFGFDMRQAQPVKALKDNEIPVCLIHGQVDDFVTCDHSYALHQANKGYSQLHIFPKAEHIRCIVTDETAYREAVQNFLGMCQQMHNKMRL